MSKKIAAEILAELRGELPREVSREEYVDWAYGQAKIENPAVTRADAERAVRDVFDAAE